MFASFFFFFLFLVLAFFAFSGFFGFIYAYCPEIGGCVVVPSLFSLLDFLYCFSLLSFFSRFYFVASCCITGLFFFFSRFSLCFVSFGLFGLPFVVVLVGWMDAFAYVITSFLLLFCLVSSVSGPPLAIIVHRAQSEIVLSFGEVVGCPVAVCFLTQLGAYISLCVSVSLVWSG